MAQDLCFLTVPLIHWSHCGRCYAQIERSCRSSQSWRCQKPPAEGWLKWFDLPASPETTHPASSKSLWLLSCFLCGAEVLPAFFQSALSCRHRTQRLSQSTGWRAWCWQSSPHQILHCDDRNTERWRQQMRKRSVPLLLSYVFNTQRDSRNQDRLVLTICGWQKNCEQASVTVTKL